MSYPERTLHSLWSPGVQDDLPLTPCPGSMGWHWTQQLTSGPPKQPLGETRPREIVPEMQGKGHLPFSSLVKRGREMG